MKQHVFRLCRGQDLFERIEQYAVEHRIRAGYLSCCVGCLTQAVLRTADGKTLRTLQEHLEIVSVTGTVSQARCHLHMTLSREDLSVVGGHMKPGCIVNTTAEVVLTEVEGVTFGKAYDPETGYDELTIERNEGKEEC